MSRKLAATFVGLLVATLLAALFPFDATLDNPLPLASANETGSDQVQIKTEQILKGTIVTLSNNQISRSIKLSDSGPLTISFRNKLTNVEYLKSVNSEFRIMLARDLTDKEATLQLSAEDFQVTDYIFSDKDKNHQQLEVKLKGTFLKTIPLEGTLYYEIDSDANFVRKWLKLEPFYANGWVIQNVTLEDWQAAGEWQPLAVVQRYPDLHSNGSDQVNYNTGRNLASVDVSNPTQRFTTGQYSRQAALYRDKNQGFYFFTESLFGYERFDGTLRLGNSDFVEPQQGFTSGRAVMGVWKGSAEIGLKRYNDYVYNNYAVIKGKKDPVWFHSWYVYEDRINAVNMTETIDDMQNAGFYDLLHIDAGWEKDAPLKVNTDPDKFPNGMEPIVTKLNGAGMKLGLWINPFSGHYESITSYEPFRKQHPNWVASNGRWLCPLSGAGQYVETRLLEIAKSWPLDVIYWDGADWNLEGCDSTDRIWRNGLEEHILNLKYFARVAQELHTIRPNLRIVVWSAPPDIHWLGAADQVQLTDIDEPPLGASELIRRQQLYHASFQRPYSAIWGDWYGLQYRRSVLATTTLPLNRLKYAEMSQIGNGATQAGGSYALDTASVDLNAFLGKMFNFRRQFEPYFNAYQHILGFPNGHNIDGEAHLIDGKGFILLYNPSEEDQTINLPLNEPELELVSGQVYNLTDWSELTTSSKLADIKLNDALPIAVPALGWRIIGVNMPVQAATVKK